MAERYYRQSLGFRDNNGAVGKVAYWIATDDTVVTYPADLIAVASAMNTAIIAMTNAKICSTSGVIQAVDPSQYGTAATYAPSAIKARLSFLGNSRLRTFTMSIPAPLLAIFFSAGGGTGGDERTVNPGNGLVAALLTAMTTGVNSTVVSCGPVTEGIHSLVRGTLVEKKNKLPSRWRKDPTGTIPA